MQVELSTSASLEREQLCTSGPRGESSSSLARHMGSLARWRKASATAASTALSVEESQSLTGRYSECVAVRYSAVREPPTLTRGRAANSCSSFGRFWSLSARLASAPTA